jgi:hypothetical protein
MFLGRRTRPGKWSLAVGEKGRKDNSSHLCWDDSKPSLFSLHGIAGKIKTMGVFVCGGHACSPYSC